MAAIIYGFNIDQAKPLFEKGTIANLLLKEITTDGKQAAVWGKDHAGFLI